MASAATDLALLAVALAAGTAVAELLGAANMGSALSLRARACAAPLLWLRLSRGGG